MKNFKTFEEFVNENSNFDYHINLIKKAEDYLALNGMESVGEIKVFVNNYLSDREIRPDDEKLITSLEFFKNRLGEKPNPKSTELGKYLVKNKLAESLNEGSLPKKGTMVKLQPSINLISFIDIKDQDLEVIGYKKTGLISGPSEFLIVKDAKGKKHEINPEYIEESVTEGKMPDKYVGNDEIVYLKTKEDSKGANYNLYYKGHDIDAGGRRFGSEKELKDFADNYILSNQWYNKLRYKDSKPLPE